MGRPTQCPHPSPLWVHSVFCLWGEIVAHMSTMHYIISQRQGPLVSFCWLRPQDRTWCSWYRTSVLWGTVGKEWRIFWELHWFTEQRPGGVRWSSGKAVICKHDGSAFQKWLTGSLHKWIPGSVPLKHEEGNMYVFICLIQWINRRIYYFQGVNMYPSFPFTIICTKLTAWIDSSLPSNAPMFWNQFTLNYFPKDAASNIKSRWARLEAGQLCNRVLFSKNKKTRGNSLFQPTC